jgi:hypothetical protein
METRPSVAYLYPAPYWSIGDSDWVKSLLLFFDQVAILLPEYMYGRHELADPSLAGPLEDLGLLNVLEPRTWIDIPARLELVSVMTELIESGLFDALDRTVHFQELSSSRAGYNVDVAVSDQLVERLFELGLARRTEDGVSLPMHPTVRTTMLVLLGQFARGVGERRSLSIHPTALQGHTVDDLRQFLRVGPISSIGRVIELDLEHVGLNVGAVPLDDVLAFRSAHIDEHKHYTEHLRLFLADLATVDDEQDRGQLLLERREELADEARRLQRQTRRAFRLNLGSFGLGIAGTAWSTASGDPLGAILGSGSLAFGLATSGRAPAVGAYSYLFSLDRRLTG